ncbi:MAG: PEP-CTERM sorting domain-containing protein [Candidatus Auribacterota bacterium]|jgi:hypothetical protein|nr:PEP-CTERM sorting domain-containing protein [Candidatus Auribacterota bacterium]
MKCKLLSALAVGMFCITSLSWAQSITVDINFTEALIDPIKGIEIPMGSAVMIMAAGGSNPMGADGSRPFLSGINDTHLNLLNDPATGFSNPTGYFDSATLDSFGGMTFPFPYSGFLVDLSDYNKGETVNLFVRVFNNILGENIPFGLTSGFDAAGNLLQFADGKPVTDALSWGNLYYFDSIVLQYTIPTTPGVQSPLVFNISNPNGMTDWNANGIGAGIWAPVPEPGAMMLMASGILLLVRRIKK